MITAVVFVLMLCALTASGVVNAILLGASLILGWKLIRANDQVYAVESARDALYSTNVQFHVENQELRDALRHVLPTRTTAEA